MCQIEQEGRPGAQLEAQMLRLWRVNHRRLNTWVAPVRPARGDTLFIPTAASVMKRPSSHPEAWSMKKMEDTAFVLSPTNSCLQFFFIFPAYRFLNSPPAHSVSTIIIEPNCPSKASCIYAPPHKTTVCDHIWK